MIKNKLYETAVGSETLEQWARPLFSVSLSDGLVTMISVQWVWADLMYIHNISEMEFKTFFLL